MAHLSMYRYCHGLASLEPVLTFFIDIDYHIMITPGAMGPWCLPVSDQRLSFSLLEGASSLVI